MTGQTIFLSNQLVSYIAPTAPATRRPAEGSEPPLRPEIGFTPKWYREALDLDFSEEWHTRPELRAQARDRIAAELKRRFGNRLTDGIRHWLSTPDLLTGVFGACTVAAIYGVPIDYDSDKWPNCEHRYLAVEELDALEPPDLESNPFFSELMQQLDWIEEETGAIHGYVNWQGVLNNAFRLRGNELFLDMALEPKRANHLFECVTTTMLDASRRVYARQLQAGVKVEHFTVSNCLVNMVSPDQYRDLLRPWDERLAKPFTSLGVHNCAWNATPYLEQYAKLSDVSYLDMGIDSDLARAKELFPQTRRALMYTPMDLANKSLPRNRKRSSTHRPLLCPLRSCSGGHRRWHTRSTGTRGLRPLPADQ